MLHFSSKWFALPLHLYISTPSVSLSSLVTAGYPSLPYFHVSFCHITPFFLFFLILCIAPSEHDLQHDLHTSTATSNVPSTPTFLHPNVMTTCQILPWVDCFGIIHHVIPWGEGLVTLHFSSECEGLFTAAVGLLEFAGLSCTPILRYG